MAATTMTEKVIRLEDILNEKDDDVKETSKIPKLKKNRKKENVPRGIPVSGRVWKNEKTRFSSIVKTRGIKKANKFEKLQKLKEDLKRVRTITKSIVEERKEQIENKKQRRRDNLKRQAENKLKSEIVQVIKNSSKIKRMRKKQLRSIEKRDTLTKK